MDEPRSAQRYLEDLTPGGSEYFDNPKRCYEWVTERLESAHGRIIVMSRERRRLKEQLRIATQALEYIHQDHRPAEPYPGASATTAEDALICMSMVE